MPNSQNQEISLKLAELNSKSLKLEDYPKVKTNKSWKTSSLANSMEFLRPIKKFKALVRYVFAMIMRKRILSFLHASARAHVHSFIQNVWNNGLIVKWRRKLSELSKHTTLTSSSVKSASILTQEWSLGRSSRFRWFLYKGLTGHTWFWRELMRERSRKRNDACMWFHQLKEIQ